MTALAIRKRRRVSSPQRRSVTLKSADPTEPIRQGQPRTLSGRLTLASSAADSVCASGKRAARPFFWRGRRRQIVERLEIAEGGGGAAVAGRGPVVGWSDELKLAGYGAASAWASAVEPEFSE